MNIVDPELKLTHEELNIFLLFLFLDFGALVGVFWFSGFGWFSRGTNSNELS
jgi:hypothetical protein